MTEKRTSSATEPGIKEFVISCTYDAPRDVVWKAWTEREQLKQWWGPKSAVILNCELDFRPGGIFHYRMRFAGQDMWGKMVYREIVKPERIVWVNSFSDEKGGVTRHPLSPSWPREMLSTLTFTEKDGKTIVTVRWSPINPTEEERKTFDEGHASMKGGWTGTFDQLADYLKNKQEENL